MIIDHKAKKIINIAWFGNTSLLLFFKKVTNKGRFSRPAETDPYVTCVFLVLTQLIRVRQPKATHLNMNIFI